MNTEQRLEEQFAKMSTDGLIKIIMALRQDREALHNYIRDLCLELDAMRMGSEGETLQ